MLWSSEQPPPPSFVHVVCTRPLSLITYFWNKSIRNDFPSQPKPQSRAAKKWHVKISETVHPYTIQYIYGMKSRKHLDSLQQHLLPIKKFEFHLLKCVISALFSFHASVRNKSIRFKIVLWKSSTRCNLHTCIYYTGTEGPKIRPVHSSNFRQHKYK